MTKDNPTFIDIEPHDPRHRQLIAAALKANDTKTLAKLRGNTDKSIRFVVNGFMYLLMASSWEEDHDAGYVVIYGIEARKTVERIASLHLGEERQESNPVTIPLNTYEFLL